MAALPFICAAAHSTVATKLRHLTSREKTHAIPCRRFGKRPSCVFRSAGYSGQLQETGDGMRRRVTGCAEATRISGKERYAMDENKVVYIRQKGAIDDPLTEILRAGARRLIAQAVEAEFVTFLASNAELVLPTVVGASFATRMIRSARSRRGSNPWTCKSRRPAIEARRQARGYASPRISCPNGRGARRASTRCCRSSTCVGFPRATSRKPFPHCSARRRPTCRRR